MFSYFCQDQIAARLGGNELMPIVPALPSSGLVGWSFLKSTLETQSKVFAQSPNISRDAEYFEKNIESIKTLDDFMGDRKIMKVALGAFGLGEELSKGAFVRKILNEGTTDTQSFAVRLNNQSYLQLAGTFDFTSGELKLSDQKIQSIVKSYKEEAFEESLGLVDDSMRLALNFEREMSSLADQNLSESVGWYRAMGSLPLRTVLESAFNLPTGFSQLDVDRQKEVLSDKANLLFGSKGINVFKDPDAVETVIRRYLLQEQVKNGPSASAPGLAALSLLSGSISSGAIFNLMVSN